MNKGSDIIFLADQSDPMENKIDALKMAMKFFLKGIPVEWCFNLWCFGSSHEKLWEGARQYNKKSLKEAERYVARWEANMGGTKCGARFMPWLPVSDQRSRRTSLS